MRQKISIPKKEKFSLLFILNALVSFVLLYSLQLYGLKWISSGLSASIMFFSPLFVVLIASAINLELNAKGILGVSLGIVGSLLMIYDQGFAIGISENSEVPGIILSFLACLALAASTFISKAISKKYNSLENTFWSMLAALPMLGLLVFLEGDFSNFHFTTNSIGYILYLSIFCSAIAFGLWNKAIQLSGPDKVASTMHIKTPVALFLGYFLANEQIDSNLIIGTIFIAIGISVTKLKWKVPFPLIKKLSHEYKPDLIVEARELPKKKY